MFTQTLDRYTYTVHGPNNRIATAHTPELVHVCFLTTLYAIAICDEINYLNPFISKCISFRCNIGVYFFPPYLSYRCGTYVVVTVIELMWRIITAQLHFVIGRSKVLFLPISYFVRSRKAMLYTCSDTFFVLFVFVCSILYFMCVHWHLLRLSTFRIIGDAVTYKIGFSDTTAAPFQHGYYIATHFFFTMRSIPFDIFLSRISRLRTITVVFLFCLG